MNEQTRTADGWTGYSQTDLAWFAEHYADTDWMVHVVGPDEIYTHVNTDLDDDDPANPELTLCSAHELAERLNRLGADLAKRISGGEEHLPALHATVFRRGVPFDSDMLMAEPFERRDLNAIARVRDFLHVHTRVRGVTEPIAVIDESREPGGFRWVLTAEDLGRALVPANRYRRDTIEYCSGEAATSWHTVHMFDGPDLFDPDKTVRQYQETHPAECSTLPAGARCWFAVEEMRQPRMPGWPAETGTYRVRLETHLVGGVEEPDYETFLIAEPVEGAPEPASFASPEGWDDAWSREQRAEADNPGNWQGDAAESGAAK